MKERYHIQIDGEHIDQFKSTIARMGAEYEFGCSLNENGKVLNADFIVELSKYELLYLRLSVRSGKIINLTNLPCENTLP
jgi:hypothetical protein